MRLTTLILLVAVLFPLCHAQKFRFSPLTEPALRQREGDAPANLQDREARIEDLFVQAGCARDRLSKQPLQNGAGTNVICRLPGKSKETIIVGANYDQEALDNWTSASLLPSLYQSLSGRKRRHTFIFVAFADSAGDLAGSQFFAGQMSQADVDHSKAMINLDALGFSPTKISATDSDKKLVELFVTVMYILKQMGSQVDISRAVHVDSEPFASLHIPQITIHSLTHEAVADLGPGEQPPVAVPDTDFAHLETGFRPDLYYNSYRLISGYLAFLDESLKTHRNSK